MNGFARRGGSVFFNHGEIRVAESLGKVIRIRDGRAGCKVGGVGSVVPTDSLETSQEAGDVSAKRASVDVEFIEDYKPDIAKNMRKSSSTMVG